jgi:hypothetical protein
VRGCGVVAGQAGGGRDGRKVVTEAANERHLMTCARCCVEESSTLRGGIDLASIFSLHSVLCVCVCVCGVLLQAGWTMEPQGPFYVWRAWAAAHLPREQVRGSIAGCGCFSAQDAGWGGRVCGVSGLLRMAKPESLNPLLAVRARLWV